MEIEYTKKDGKRFLLPSNFQTCYLDGKTKKEIINLYPKISNWKNEYYIQKFLYHLKNQHSISIQKYIEKFFNFEWKKTNGIYHGFKITGNSIIESTYLKGGVNKNNCENFKKSCEKLSKDRMGKDNPMYGKKPWNKGLDTSHPSLKRVSDKLKNRKASEETKKKQRVARQNHPLKARHTTPHSKETKDKLRKITAKRYNDGIYNKKSSIHLKVEKFLKSLDLKFKSEYNLSYYSIDVAFPKFKLAIEIQGDFFHSNPILYPDGPICKIQKRNFYNDKRKHSFLNEEKWHLLELWETEINDETYKNKLTCKLRELKILKN